LEALQSAALFQEAPPGRALRFTPTDLEAWLEPLRGALDAQDTPWANTKVRPHRPRVMGGAPVY
jgi:hypothetical protein